MSLIDSSSDGNADNGFEKVDPSLVDSGSMYNSGIPGSPQAQQDDLITTSSDLLGGIEDIKNIPEEPSGVIPASVGEQPLFDMPASATVDSNIVDNFVDKSPVEEPTPPPKTTISPETIVPSTPCAFAGEINIMSIK